MPLPCCQGMWRGAGTAGPPPRRGSSRRPQRPQTESARRHGPVASNGAGGDARGAQRIRAREGVVRGRMQAASSGRSSERSRGAAGGRGGRQRLQLGDDCLPCSAKVIAGLEPGHEAHVAGYGNDRLGTKRLSQCEASDARGFYLLKYRSSDRHCA